MYLWETSHNQSLGQVDWTLILGWHQKGLNAGVKRPECFNRHASPLGFSEWAGCFVGLGSFLGLMSGHVSLLFQTISLAIQNALLDTKRLSNVYFLNVF